MRPSRDLLASVLLFAVLVGLAMLLATRQKSEQQRPEEFWPYSTHSAQPSGTAALAMWLEAIGYRVERIEGASFTLPNQAKAVYIFPCGVEAGCAPISDRETEAIIEWIEHGNTLIVAGDIRFGLSELGKALKVDTHSNRLMAVDWVEQPVQGDLAPHDVVLETSVGLEMNRADYVEYFTSGNMPLLVSFRMGEGRVWVTSAPRLFVNANLRNEANAAVVGAMLSGVPSGSLVAFDEYHISTPAAATRLIPGSDSGLSQLLWNTPAGWAFLYALLVVFAYLLLNGQRLGRAVPAAQALVRRLPAEYIVAMAHLFRRAHKREMVLSHYHAGLKRRLARPFGISPDLSDEEFVAALAAVSHVDAAALRQTLHGLSQKQVGEQDLVKLAHQAVQFYKPQG